VRSDNSKATKTSQDKGVERDRQRKEKQQEEESVQSPKVLTNIELREQDPTNFVPCFKGGRTERLLKLFSSPDRGNESVFISSSPPTDFSRSPENVYLTYSYNVAMYYARTSRRVKGEVDRNSPIEILTFQIPKRMIAEAVKISGDHWKEASLFYKLYPNLLY